MFGKREGSDKEDWFVETKLAYEEFLSKRRAMGNRLGTFSEIEAQAAEAGDRLTRFLIEKAISEESTESGEEKECNCPRCGKPSKRKDDESERREIESKRGPVSFTRPGYYCTAPVESLIKESTNE